MSAEAGQVRAAIYERLRKVRQLLSEVEGDADQIESAVEDEVEQRVDYEMDRARDRELERRIDDSCDRAAMLRAMPIPDLLRLAAERLDDEHVEDPALVRELEERAVQLR